MSTESRGSPFVRLRHAAGAGLCLLLFAQVASPPVGAQQSTKQQLDAAQKKVKALERSIENARARLSGIRAEIDVLTSRIQQAHFQLDAVREHIGATKAAIEKNARRIKRLQGQLNERARSVYMAGPAGAVELVLEADSLADLSNRVAFLEVLSQRDADVAAGIEVEQEELRRHTDDLKEVEAEQERLLQQLEQQNGQLQAKFAEQQRVTEGLVEKKEEAEDLVDRLEKKYRREQRILAAQIAAASASIPASGPPPSADGPFYHCPVDQPRSYTDDFGVPRSGGRTHQGNDIFAPAGTPIRAPFAGTATESSNSLGGLSVHVYGAGGDFVYNAHLSRYAGVNGQQVKPGDLIGYVGTTGNAVGTPPHDHFEYHPGGAGAVSPYVYLNEVCGVGGGGF